MGYTGKCEHEDARSHNVTAVQCQMAIDNYMGFTWNGIHSSKFNCFITSKDGLKFVNSPSFSNSLVSSLNQNKAYYTGMTLQSKKIQLTIAAVDLTLDEYNQLLNWLSIYDISTLRLDYQPWYQYNVKLSAIGNSTKHVTGRYQTYYPQGSKKAGQPMPGLKDLYTCEMSIEFETVADHYAESTFKYVGNSKHTDHNAEEFGYLENELAIPAVIIAKSSDNSFDVDITNVGSVDCGFILCFYNVNGSIKVQDRTDQILYTELNFDSQHCANLYYNSNDGLVYSCGQLIEQVKSNGEYICLQKMSLSNRMIKPGETKHYTISFTNKGNDFTPAIEVILNSYDNIA